MYLSMCKYLSTCNVGKRFIRTYVYCFICPTKNKTMYLYFVYYLIYPDNKWIKHVKNHNNVFYLDIVIMCNPALPGTSFAIICCKTLEISFDIGNIGR